MTTFDLSACGPHPNLHDVQKALGMAGEKCVGLVQNTTNPVTNPEDAMNEAFPGKMAYIQSICPLIWITRPDHQIFLSDDAGESFTFVIQLNVPAADILPIGTIIMYGGAVEPDGWLFCRGQEVSRATYTSLFSLIGTTYGAGDGTTTFNLPSASGRAPIGATGLTPPAGITLRALGDVVGAETHQLTISELPSHHHNHPTNPNFVRAVGTNNGGLDLDQATGGHNNSAPTATVGNDQPHNNMQPSFVTNFLIKYI